MKRKILSEKPQHTPKPIKSEVRLRISRTRSYSRCSRNVILSGLGSGGLATAGLLRFLGGGRVLRGAVFGRLRRRRGGGGVVVRHGAFHGRRGVLGGGVDPLEGAVGRGLRRLARGRSLQRGAQLVGLHLVL